VRKEQSYLLRLWNDGKQPVWRATLEDVRSREVMTFTTLEQLSDYLRCLDSSTENSNMDEH
jgi:hypothetical protein